ncbi:MAG TPA: T9SS type A sorting domain-containing protein [Candidatus Kapabacteria bacterium]|nr:T9SS type A sorting domain-containing protein [Candidatus Kapabacteria bacterium]
MKTVSIAGLAILFILIVSMSTSPLYAQPFVQWQKSFGGTSRENASSLIQTHGDDYLIAGYSRSTDRDVTVHHGSSEYTDFWIVKMDSFGNIIWQRSFGGSSYDEANAVCETNDGYVIAGLSRSNDGDVTGHHGNSDFADYWIIKIDTNGQLLWQRSLGGSDNDVANAIAATRDGGFIVAGSSNSSDGDVTGHHGTNDYADYWVVKLDASGNTQWQRSLGGTSDDEANSVIQTEDGGYVIAGTSSSTDGDITGNHGGDDCWIVKLDSSGNIIWQRSLGGTANDGTSSIVQSRDGGFVVAAYAFSDDGDVTGHHLSNMSADYWILKLNARGELQWQYSYGGSRNDYARSITPTNDGGFAIAGTSESNDGDVTMHQGAAECTDYWIVKIDSAGRMLWQETAGRMNNDDASAIIQSRNGSYVVAGSSNPFPPRDRDESENYDYWVVKLDAVDNVQQIQQTAKATEYLFPNPMTSSAELMIPSSIVGITSSATVIISDIAGREVKRITDITSPSVVIVRDGMQNGNYIYRILRGNNVIATGKMVIQ